MAKTNAKTPRFCRNVNEPLQTYPTAVYAANYA